MKKDTKTRLEVQLKVHKCYITKALAEDSLTVGYKKRLSTSTWTVIISYPVDGNLEPQEFSIQTYSTEANARKLAKEVRQMVLDMYGEEPRSWSFQCKKLEAFLIFWYLFKAHEYNILRKQRGDGVDASYQIW